MILGITDNGRPDLNQYFEWVSRADQHIECIKLSSAQGNEHDLQRCNGLILTGGGDIHPKMYGREDALDLVKGVDIRRDKFEFDIVHRALDMEIPVLGVCRGMQIVNVASGGTLVPDLEHAGFQNHRKGEDGSERLHAVRVDHGTLLSAVVQVGEGEVNSSHHQAVDGIGRSLRAVARSVDGVTEALESEDPSRRPWILLIQWHPERMKNFESPFSKNILERFVHEAKEGRTQKVVRKIPTTRNT